MPSLHWIFAPMNSSKSAQLLMVAHNYEERGMKVITVKPKLDTRDGEYIKSRALDVKRKADVIVSKTDSVFQKLREFKGEGYDRIGAILVDEAQFLTREQVDELGEVVDRVDLPVMAYGLRTDSFGNMFEGSMRLFEICDNIQEFKTICPCCGSKAIFNMRIDGTTGKPVFEGEQIAPGTNYLPVCRKYYKELKDQYS
jgi:thymidine kinase